MCVVRSMVVRGRMGDVFSGSGGRIFLGENMVGG